MHLIYMNKTNRDSAWKKIPKVERKNYVRTSFRNQLMHPMYVEDYEDEMGIQLTDADKGFGNEIYMTHFKVLYIIENKPDWMK